MAIEIIEVITLQEYRAIGLGANYDDIKIKEAINTAFLQLNSVCDHNISKRWNLPDTDPLYLPDDKKQYAKEAFCLQTTWNLKNNLNMGSLGSQQTSLGDWSHSYNNPKDKEVICPGVLDLLQQATLYKPVASKSMNVLNRPCGVPPFSVEPVEGDVADLAFVRWGEANNKFLAKFQGTTYANKILYIDTNGYIRLKDINDFTLTKYQKINDNNLQTNNKTIVGAINELNAIKISSQNVSEVEIQSTSTIGDLNVGQATIDFQNPTLQIKNLSIKAFPYSTTTTLVNCRFVGKTTTSFIIEIVWVGNTTAKFTIETLWINTIREA